MEKGPQKNDKKSLAMLMSAMFIFGSIGIFRRMIPLSSAWVAFFRGAVGSLFLVLFILARHGSRKSLDRGVLAKLILTGSLIGINWALLFEAYNYTTVSVATLCYYMAPTFMIILSCIIFRERLTPLKVTCAVTSLIGMVLVSGVAEKGTSGGIMSGITNMMSGGLSGEAKGILFGLGAAVLYATVVLINKSIKISDSYSKTIVQLVAASVVLIPYLVLKDGAPAAEWNIELIALLATLGIVHTGLAYVLYFGSMEGLKTQTVAIFSYIDPVTALILSNVVLHEELTFFGLFGAVLILGSALISGLSNA